MSTVERAFLRDEAERDSVVERSEGIVTKAVTPVFTKKKDARQLVSSRNSISKMSQSQRYTWDELKAKHLIYSNMQEVKLLDRYRNLRTRLLAKSKKENFITLITSVVPDDDTCLVSANLAATFALDEAKTSMLIEANIQNPNLNKIFELEDQKGLIDYIETDDIECGDFLCQTKIQRLRVVPSGLPRENSAEYFTSDKMHSFVSELVCRYPDRFPIINAPSIIDSADARILIDLCDQVVLVVPYGKCSEDDILQASIAIGEEKLSGIVLNNFY